jgi:signal transduction histidine kinase
MRLSIPAKIFAGFAAVLVTFSLVAASSVYQLHRVGVGLSLVSNTYHPLTRHAAQLDESFRQSAQASERLQHETDVGTRRGLLRLALEYYPRAAREKVKAAQAVVAEARKTARQATEVAFLDRVDGLLDGVLVRYAEYQRVGAGAGKILDRLEDLRRQNQPTEQWESQFDASIRELKKTEEGLASTLKDLEAELDDRIDLRVLQAAEEEPRAVVTVVLFALVAALISVFVTVLAQRTLAPIRSLTEAVKEFGEGRFARELPVKSDDELAILAGEFNAMARKLRDRDRQLQEKTMEVLRAERLAAVGRLAAQITHEIRNPLSSLSLNAELLQERLDSGVDEPAGREEATALLKSMSREVERLAEITEEYLRFARHPKPDFAAVDLNDAVEEVLDFMSAELGTGGVSAARDLAALAPRVRADSGQLRQVLLNLIRNAREAAGSGGHIRLSTRMDVSRRVALLEVEDDGPGIPAALQSHLFEPFFTTKERGTGLGLAVVQQIIHEHGGEVSCHSVVPHGTRFVVTLPLDESAETGAAQRTEEPGLPAAVGR